MVATMQLEARRSFPGAEEKAQLDAAGVSIVSAQAAAAVGEFLAQATNDAGGAHHGGRLEHARAATAGLLGARPHQIALIPSTSAGLNVVASSIPIGRGDNVVTSEIEFVSIVAPFQRRCEQSGGELRVARSEGGRLEAEHVLEIVDARTRAVVLSSVVWTTGYRVRHPGDRTGVPPPRCSPGGRRDPAARGDPVRRRRGVCRGCRLRRPQVAGLAGCARRALRERRLLHPLPAAAPVRADGAAARRELARPVDAAGLHADAGLPARRRGTTLQVGCHHAAMAAAGLAAAVDVIRSAGMEMIREHVLALGELVAAELAALGLEVVSDLGADNRSGITTFHAGRSAEDDVTMQRFLRERDVITAVRYTAGAGGTRISCHLYNNARDIDRLLAAVKEKLGR